MNRFKPNMLNEKQRKTYRLSLHQRTRLSPFFWPLCSVLCTEISNISPPWHGALLKPCLVAQAWGHLERQAAQHQDFISDAWLCSSALHTPANLGEFPTRARSSPQSKSVMQSWAHDDSCYYIWDCIVCSDDKPVEGRDSECICQRKREREKKKQEFVSPSGFFWCVYVRDVFVLSLCGQTHTEKSVFASGNLESSTFSMSHIWIITQYYNVNTRISPGDISAVLSMITYHIFIYSTRA